mmetsp:Transcript_3714/g.5492  ORF Transcript_3714/g.5492 Transcript_3714/m.5492 type:complete len:200 (+) Transcript_3714:387-986(+)
MLLTAHMMSRGIGVLKHFEKASPNNPPSVMLAIPPNVDIGVNHFDCCVIVCSWTVTKYFGKKVTCVYPTKSLNPAPIAIIQKLIFVTINFSVFHHLMFQLHPFTFPANLSIISLFVSSIGLRSLIHRMHLLKIDVDFCGSYTVKNCIIPATIPPAPTIAKHALHDNASLMYPDNKYALPYPIYIPYEYMDSGIALYFGK